MEMEERQSKNRGLPGMVCGLSKLTSSVFYILDWVVNNKNNMGGVNCRRTCSICTSEPSMSQSQAGCSASSLYSRSGCPLSCLDVGDMRKQALESLLRQRSPDQHAVPVAFRSRCRTLNSSHAMPA
uniref:Uncharacterized protein n=1 Tax=Mus musculus TaxID=10090 RepID=Q3UTU4_MOUSE|nr:unnamed protein product [Mus musculus]